jgi:DNA-directed RNA polymerase subunit L
MEITILKQEKEDAELEIDRVTAAEVLRVYLNEQDGVEFAAWRREHPSKPALMKIKTKGKTVKKAISDAVAAVKKDADALVKVLK